MPGLDGLRALAVAAVVAYHLNLSWAPGGLLGVGIFFTLSGYLITDLLLSSWEAHGHLRLREFWARRARRLLPALFVMLIVVTIWVAVADPGQLGAVRGDVAAASIYMSNWWLAFQKVSYFARFGPPSPLGHLWSLAVEEQFYLVWPWLLWLALRRLKARERRDGRLGAPAPVNGPEASWPAGRAVARRLGIPPARLRLVPLALLTLLLAGASAAEMTLLYHPSFDPSRVYDGTDTRAFGLLFGAALAMVWPSKGLRAPLRREARRLVDLAGMVGLVVVGLLLVLTTQYSAFLYRGGLVLLSVATVMVVAAAAHPASRLGNVLGCRPLRWVGVRSYAIYLWHYPVIVLTTPTVSEGTDILRPALQVGATLLLADLSWRFVETPVRNGALGRIWGQLSQVRLAGSTRFSRSAAGFPAPARWLALCTAPVALVVGALALAGLMPTVPAGTLSAAAAPPAGPQLSGTRSPGDADGSGDMSSFGSPSGTAGNHGSRTSSTTNPFQTRSAMSTTVTALRRPPTAATAPTSASVPTSASAPTSATASTAATTTAATTMTAPTTTAPTTTTRATSTSVSATSLTSTRSRTVAASRAPTSPKAQTSGTTPVLRTSCAEVVHVGDSTSESLVSSDYLPDASQRLAEQYARVGVKLSIMRIQGGTSIVESIPGTPNAYNMAQDLVRKGYRGCWVMALGTNEAANVYVGSNVGMRERIQRMMTLVHGAPVLWVNVRTLLTSGPYAEANMQRWDDALVAACRIYPNMRVFNWAGAVKRSWFTSDGIHYDSPGSAPRAAAIADALAVAFPAMPRPSGASGTSGSRHAASNGGCVINAAPDWHLPAYHY